jgi:predicted ester cyclase
MSKTNKELIRDYIDIMWNRHDFEKAMGYLTPEMAELTVPHARELLDAFSDLSVEILEPGFIGDGEYVAMRLLVSGVHDGGEFAGQPPSRKRLSWESFRIMRLVGGKIAGTWVMQDRLGLLEQLGAIESRAAEVHWAAGDDSGATET